MTSIHIYVHCIGSKYQHPPPLPSIHVKHQFLVNEIITKLLQATIDPCTYEATLTITGAGGFGKTSTVISLCHQAVVKEQFSDSFIFIELGPQATDPSIKLKEYIICYLVKNVILTLWSRKFIKSQMIIIVIFLSSLMMCGMLKMQSLL